MFCCNNLRFSLVHLFYTNALLWTERTTKKQSHGQIYHFRWRFIYSREQILWICYIVRRYTKGTQKHHGFQNLGALESGDWPSFTARKLHWRKWWRKTSNGSARHYQRNLALRNGALKCSEHINLRKEELQNIFWQIGWKFTGSKMKNLSVRMNAVVWRLTIEWQLE